VIAMPRTIWLAVFCLLVLGALFALRRTIGAPTMVGSTAAAPPSAIEADGPPLAKSDRLPAPVLERAEAKASVTTVKIAPEPADAKASPKTAASERKEITSWHWRAGSKITRRSTVVGQPKSERER
jgi:hypothetical protein